MTEIWIYEGRNSAAQAFWNYQDARKEQDEDNGCTLEDIQQYPELYGNPDYGGSEEKGYFYIDDGGSITKVRVEGTRPGFDEVDPIETEKVALPPVEFSVGDSVRTTQDWNDRFHEGQGYSGRVCDIVERGHGPDEKRRVQVIFPKPVFWSFDRLWFDPDELELDSD